MTQPGFNAGLHNTPTIFQFLNRKNISIQYLTQNQATQETNDGAQHRGYIDRKKENSIFAPQ